MRAIRLVKRSGEGVPSAKRREELEQRQGGQDNEKVP